LDHLVPNEDSTVKIATSESTCSSLTGASHQNAGKAKPVDIEEDDIIKVIGKEHHSADKRGAVEGGYEEENKDKLKDLIPNGVVTRRSTRPKNLKPTKLDDFMGKLSSNNSISATDMRLSKNNEISSDAISSLNIC
jgi:hypothetical protein